MNSASTTSTRLPLTQRVAFIGGGNMAAALIGGLLRQGQSASQIDVVDPFAPTRAGLLAQFGIHALAQADASLHRAEVVVWAVKPQTFSEAAAQVATHLGDALHLSVAAGIRSDTIAGWLGSQRVIRAMPNTPALVGCGITALLARAAVSAADRVLAEQIVDSVGSWLWVDSEPALDAVTALSGSGPAYVFYFVEAMIQAGVELGLSAAQAQQLAIGTFAGAAELARRSDETPAALRQRVTSKGGTTHAAISAMQRDGVAEHFINAMHQAAQRAQQLGDAFGAGRV